jgi:adenine-specific DNA methylase
MSKKEYIAEEVAKAVGAGKAVALETVDFNDPNRPKTCLEVDFPILPVNQVAVIEGNAGKPIYQMSKWWARRRSSVFRAMLIAAAAKAPEDESRAAKLVWENYYANHQKKGAFKKIKAADIFMGGGTTLVEGSRLGMQMIGNDLNPVAWFVVKQEFAKVDIEEVKRLLADIEAEVKPQIMPYYYCDGPDGEKGEWTHKPTGRVMSEDFDPLSIPWDKRKEYDYKGPEIIYTFWAKHGPCQVTGCGHRTPIMTSPVMAIKTLTVKAKEFECLKCGVRYDVEKNEARMAPDVPLYVAPDEKPYAILDKEKGEALCPECGNREFVDFGKGKNKKVELTLLVHPQWLSGSSKEGKDGKPYGGSAQDDAESTARWGEERASKIRLLEVRGKLPEEVTCPKTGVTFKTKNGTVPHKSHYACGACGTEQDVLETVKATGKTGPMAAYAVQGYAPKRDENGLPYSGRFFAPYTGDFAKRYDAAFVEWEARKENDLKDYWPKSAIPVGAEIGPHDVNGHHYSHWWTMFNHRQLLVLSQLLKGIVEAGNYDWTVREFVLGAFQQYLRNQNMFCFWNLTADKMEPHYSRNNFHPKFTVVENGVFSLLGRGNWLSCVSGVIEGAVWTKHPWEIVSVEGLNQIDKDLAEQCKEKSEKVSPNDPVESVEIVQCSSTELCEIDNLSLDLIITDPPFGGIMQYSELSDFFYVWLRLVLQKKYPQIFAGEYTPKSMEAVANSFRESEDPDGFYQRVLTECWEEANRILKPAGILVFTFHHDKDRAWVAVLESLFDAGFYLEATYPIRSDETKGEGQFGSEKIEYDIIHVCRKRTGEPTAVSWGKMRREVMADVNKLKDMLENHVKQGLPAADLQVIRRGKALEYFSRHYGKVFVDEDQTMSVKDALLGINLLIDEDADKGRERPPANAEPITRQFLRIFDGIASIERDQLQKFLKGSITTPDEFSARGWCHESNKVYYHVKPLDFALDWQGRHKRRLTSDLDQALVLIGACFEGSGINAMDTLKNENFKAHVALSPLLEWFVKHGPDSDTKNAAVIAVSIFKMWSVKLSKDSAKSRQLKLFEDDEI